MVMSAGQRNYLINRNDDPDENQYRKDDGDIEKLNSGEYEHKADGEGALDYDADDYRDHDQVQVATKKAPPRTKTRARSKVKKLRIKTIEPKLNNFSVARNFMVL